MSFFQAFWVAVALANAQAPVGVRLAFEPATLDWTLGDVPIHVINNTVEGLYRYDARGQIVADEADGMPRRITPKKGLWRITLRHDLRWSDGRPVTAADYEAAWDRLKAPRTASTYSDLLADFETAHASAPDRFDVVLRDRARQDFPLGPLTHWATFPVRADLIAAHPSGWGSRPEDMAFNGPYRIESYEHESRLTLVPNARHRSPGTLARIEALIVADDSTALRLYQSGRLHFLPELNTIERVTLATRADYHWSRSPVLVYLGLGLGLGPTVVAPELATPAARKLLSRSIDRAAFSKLLATSCTPTLSIDPALAGQALETAPAPAPAKSPFSGKSLEFGYYEKGLNRSLAELIQSQWKSAIGLETRLQANEVKSYWTRLADRPFPVFLNSFSPPVPEPEYYFRLLMTGNPMNMGRWSQARYDQAVTRGDFKAARAIFDDEQPIIPLYFRPYDYLLSPKLTGAELNPMMSLDLRRARLRPE